MGDPLPVGSSYKNVWLIGPLVLGVLSAGAEAIWGKEWNSKGLWYGVGFAFLLIAAVVWGVLYLRRRWLRVADDGFSVEGPGFRETWRDAEVERMTWSSKKNYVNGVASSETCKAEFWNARGRRILMVHRKPLEQATPFSAFVGRVFESLSARKAAVIDGGGDLEGENWKLGKEWLTWKGGELRVAEVSGVGEFDGQVRVWKTGSNDAIFAVKASSANAGVLRRLLEDRRPKDVEGKALESGDDLGKVLFERLGTRNHWMYWLLGIFVVLIGALTTAASAPWGVAVLAAGAGICYWGWWVGGLMFRCHEWGVSRRTRRGVKTIRYRDTAGYTYRATRHYVNGAYTGTSLAMIFVSRPELGREKINWSSTVRGMDDEIDNLRDHISKVMAARWVEDLKAGKSIAWTDNLRLHPDGIEYRPSGFLGRKDWTKTSYELLAPPQMEKGVFYLFLQGEKKSSTSEVVSAPNFFPGFYVLMMVLQAGQSQNT